jgi:hypothetical protein
MTGITLAEYFGLTENNRQHAAYNYTVTVFLNEAVIAGRVRMMPARAMIQHGSCIRGLNGKTGEKVYRTLPARLLVVIGNTGYEVGTTLVVC